MCCFLVSLDLFSPRLAFAILTDLGEYVVSVTRRWPVCFETNEKV